MAGFTYSPLPDNHPTDSDTYWARRAQERNLAMQAKRAATPLNIPSLHQLYRDGDAAHDAQAAERQADIAAGDLAW